MRIHVCKNSLQCTIVGGEHFVVLMQEGWQDKALSNGVLGLVDADRGIVIRMATN